MREESRGRGDDEGLGDLPNDDGNDQLEVNQKQVAGSKKCGLLMAEGK